MNFKVLISYSLPQIPKSQWKLAAHIEKSRCKTISDHLSKLMDVILHLMRVNVNRTSGLIKETTLNSTLCVPFKNEEFNIPKFIPRI